MKFIVKMYLSSGEIEYYLDVGEGTTPNRSEVFVFDSEIIRGYGMPVTAWLDKKCVRVIPVGDL